MKRSTNPPMMITHFRAGFDAALVFAGRDGGLPSFPHILSRSLKKLISCYSAPVTISIT